MCLLTKAAVAWHELVGIEYVITAGRRGKLYQIRLQFSDADFPHLAGMQYARDVAFNLNPDEYYGYKLIPALIAGKINGNLIEKGRNWPKIEGRLKAVLNLQSTLETRFRLARFHSNNVKTGSKIEAEYVIQNLESGETYFVFIDEDADGRQYCKSAFEKTNVDYMINQPLLTVLEVRKKMENGEITIYQHSNYIT